MSDLCATTGCTDECVLTCGSEGRCSHRKHFRKGGVCCMSCFTSCARCGVSVYWEDVYSVPPGVTADESWACIYEEADLESFDPDDQWDLPRLCHCCAIETSPNPQSDAAERQGDA